MSSSIQSLTTLLKRSEIEDHHEVLNAANAALKENKGDLEAQHIKVIALLKLDQYADAVKAVEAGGAKLKDKAQLEYAYALYKSGNPAQAAEIARNGTQRGYKHVEAQSRYRVEDFQRASDLYRELAASPGEEDADLDLRVNSSAVEAQLTWSGHEALAAQKKPSREDLEAFETAYNAACGSIARGELAQGEVLLKRARDLCDALEDMTEEDKKAELLPIMVQQVYVLTRLGREEEAQKLSQSIAADSIADSSTRQIAQVNGVASTPALSNPFLAHRLVSKSTDSSKSDHPFQFQSTILKQNRYAVDLRSLKFDGTIHSTSTALSKQPSSGLDAYNNSLSVINAAAHAKSVIGKEALKHILPLLEKRPNDVGLVLTIVQIYVLTGNTGSAIALLEGLLDRLPGQVADQDVRFAPGLVGAMVGLYRQENRKASAQRELAKAATHWRRKSKEHPAGLANLLKAAGSALLESDDPEHRKLAADIFSDLQKQRPNDLYATAGLLAASPSSASEAQISSLTPVEKLISGIDAAALEEAGIAVPTTGAQVVQRKRPATDSNNAKAVQKRKKLRKSRMPKDYDPNKTPDPERWLPLRDRSTYRPKGGKKGKARANLLSQGAAPTGADSDGSRPGTPGGEVVKAKQQQGGGGGKKKKGKR